MPAEPPRPESGLFTRRTWLLLGGLVLFSLGAWGIVQLWPTTGGPHGVIPSPVASQGGGTQIRSPIVHQDESFRESSSSPISVTGSEPSRTRPATHDSRSFSAPVHEHAFRQIELSPTEATLPTQSAWNQTRAPSSVPRTSTPEEIGAPDAVAHVLDQRKLEELNQRLSAVLVALNPSAAGFATRLAEPYPEHTGNEMEKSVGVSVPHAAGHPASDGLADVGTTGGEREDEALPVVHVSVDRRKDSSDVALIRSLEEELGRALRARDWATFDLTYNRLAALRTGEALIHWRAARAMTGADYAQARQLLELLLRDNPFDLRAGLNMALVLEAQGEIAAARDLARNLSKRHPLDPSLHAQLDRLENTRSR